MSGPMGRDRWWTAATAIGVLGAYATTLPPGITFEDAGGFLAAAASGGHAHPPGYPLYCLLLRGWLGLTGLRGVDAARAGAWLSSLMAAAAAAVTQRVLVGWRAMARGGEGGNPSPDDGLPCALATLLAFAALDVWRQSILVEVYALHLLVVALFLQALVAERPRRVGLLVGLGLANHSSAVHLIPMALVWWALLLGRRGVRHAGRALTTLPLGLLLYLYLPLAEARQPPLGMGDASTWRGFWSMVTRAGYGDVAGTPLSQRLEAALSVPSAAGEQWGLVTGVVVLAGLVLTLSSGPRRARALALFALVGVILNTVVTALLSTGFPTSDLGLSQLAVGFLPAYLLAAAMLPVAADRARLGRAATAVALGALVSWATLRNHPRVDMGDYRWPGRYAEAVARAVGPGDAVLIADADEFLTPLFHLKYVEHRLPRLALTIEDLLKDRTTLGRLARREGLEVGALQGILGEYWRLRAAGRGDRAQARFEEALHEAVSAWLGEGRRVFLNADHRGPIWSDLRLIPVGPCYEVLRGPLGRLPPFVRLPEEVLTDGHRDVWTRIHLDRYAWYLMWRALEIRAPERRRALIEEAFRRVVEPGTRENMGQIVRRLAPELAGTRRGSL